MAVISDRRLLELLSRVCELEGDFVEVGVFRGATFTRLAFVAQATGRVAHAFDSFQGMAPPTRLDFGQYPEGKMSIGGVDKFEATIKAVGVPASAYQLWPGFIPDCFTGFDKDIAFALVDVDQFEPTRVALEWVWPRLVVGGILVLDDYFRHRQGLASRAIEDWLVSRDPVEARVLDYIDTQLYVQKAYIEPKPLP